MLSHVLTQALPHQILKSPLPMFSTPVENPAHCLKNNVHYALQGGMVDQIFVNYARETPISTISLFFSGSGPILMLVY